MIQDIMLRSSRPTCSIWWSRSWARSRSNSARPACADVYHDLFAALSALVEAAHQVVEMLDHSAGLDANDEFITPRNLLLKALADFDGGRG